MNSDVVSRNFEPISLSSKMGVEFRCIMQA